MGEIPPYQPIDDEEAAYREAHQALVEALEEQATLRDRLNQIAKRNMPAEWGQPVIITPIEGRIRSNNANLSPAEIIHQLESTELLLSRTKQSVASLNEEKAKVQKEITDILEKAPYEVAQIVSDNAMKHKLYIMNLQRDLEKEINIWAVKKRELLSESEQLSISSQMKLRESVAQHEKVDAQRAKTQQLAAELRQLLTKSKELRDILDDYKVKVNLIETLEGEIEANKMKSDKLLVEINQQKMLLRAKKVSDEAQKKIDQQNDQILELKYSVGVAQNELERAKSEKINLQAQENVLKQSLEEATDRFKAAQTQVSVLESEIDFLTEELNKIKGKIKDENEKNVELNKTYRSWKLEAVEEFIGKNHKKIHRPERVVESLNGVMDEFYHRERPSTVTISEKKKPKIRVSKKPRPQTEMLSARRKPRS
ncbi:hypothetical protein TVAG_065730 [Trichomonas vaginalis G3]|uniref:Uncharacterized protein n=1 Tax=Trichomonas vaginalis (strain ATCC PRA-98 / G3) TaxID=412133 RepID=A2ELX7_TRIV3|nr:tropomyosin family [Trichomonas vaginalis G3]EAY06316.1 hypothetical protein TVAG_065730 [Trichomonas vaginalis G3]KAI5489852.1 tropomyosin family [Trichomonas vaginalis G3]|eukprot:XP_001318539.1 hypothetical protein [Trichomonas vaginalis G3]